jgi:hypothetical protein
MARLGMDLRDGSHRKYGAAVANAAATAFPPPLRGRDREGGSNEQGIRRHLVRALIVVSEDEDIEQLYPI